SPVNGFINAHAIAVDEDDAVFGVGEVSLEDWRWAVDINLWGVIYGCHSFVPRMRAAGGGYILNVASAAGLLSAPMMAPYNVTKAGVVALSETLHAELKRERIHVTALCPTFFRSQIHTQTRAPTKLSDTTTRLVTGARWSAEAIAEVALAGLERNDLYVVPQIDGKLMWRLKRLVAGRFHGVLSLAQHPAIKRKIG
ncbi:MAG: SDR family NAD(P)-dependent oxidoreductase, partial [Myxococcales bacterium]|nr:SDR family NAD(P)-dependent oxidoreductase [Myxococcales bacterium]